MQGSAGRNGNASLGCELCFFWGWMDGDYKDSRRNSVAILQYLFLLRYKLHVITRFASDLELVTYTQPWQQDESHAQPTPSCNPAPDPQNRRSANSIITQPRDAPPNPPVSPPSRPPIPHLDPVSSPFINLLRSCTLHPRAPSSSKLKTHRTPTPSSSSQTTVSCPTQYPRLSSST